MQKSQLSFIMANNSRPHFIVSDSTLKMNGLVYGYDYLKLWTPYEALDNLDYHGGTLEYYNIIDDKYIILYDRSLQLYLPNAEKSIIDTIMHLDNYYIEGFLIEALQNYIQRNSDLSSLYDVADYYGLDRDELNYWINEAREESDMSMG